MGGLVLVVTMNSLPLPVALWCSAAGASLTALLVGYPVLRVRGPYFVILTFGLAELTKHIVVQIETQLGQFSRLIFDAPSLLALYFSMLGLAVGAAAAARLIPRSQIVRRAIGI